MFSVLINLVLFFMVHAEDSPRFISNQSAMMITRKYSDVLHEERTCQQLWFYYSIYTKKCECIHNNVSAISCQGEKVALVIGHCATFDEKTELTSIYRCPYFKLHDSYNITEQGLLLPDNISQLNDFMCTPMNRKGFVCSECINGFGLSVTSSGHDCSECKSEWQGIVLYLLFELVPITVFYVLILIFRINLVSAPFICLMMYSQLLYYEIENTPGDDSIEKVIFTREGTLRPGIKILLALSGFWNLNLLHHLIPSFCLSNHLKPFHITLLDYFTSLYPFVLILLTYVFIELHGHNIKPLVFLCNPFHKCFFHLRRVWDTRNDMINVFCSFIALSFGKVAFQVINTASCRCLSQINKLGIEKSICRTSVDPNIECYGTEHFKFIIPAAIMTFIFNILPTLLLVLYPLKQFRLLLSKCRMDSIVLNTFIEKFHGCYRDGLDGRRDMRSFSGLYFFLTGLLTISHPLSLKLHLIEPNAFLSQGLLLWFAALTVALIKPYKKTYLNVLDSLLLAYIGMLCNVLPAAVQANSLCTLLPQVLLTLPFIVYIVYILKKVLVMMYNLLRNMYRGCKSKRVRNFKALNKEVIISVGSKTTTYGTLDAMP